MSRRACWRWVVSLAATAASTFASDTIAAATGLLLASSGLLDGVGHLATIVVLALSYLVWSWALRANLRANWALLEATGTSTSALSKAGHALARRRSDSERAAQLAVAAGYVAMELAAEVLYYMGAFGVLVLSDSVTTRDAVVFLAGANLGAALYEYGLARVTGAFLRARALRPLDRRATYIVAATVAGPSRSR